MIITLFASSDCFVGVAGDPDTRIVGYISVVMSVDRYVLSTA